MSGVRAATRARVLIITQLFDPEPCIKGMAFARALHDLGFEVEVLTGFPNYPGGVVYNGYTLKLYSKEVLDGITIHRTYVYPSHDRSGVRRAATYLSFALSVLLAGLMRIRRPDVIYAYHPPATVGWAGAVLAIMLRARLVLDVQDLWPETIESSGMMRSRVLLEVLRRVCAWGYKRADVIVALSPTMGKAIARKGVVHDRLRVIYNWADEARLRVGLLPERATALVTAANGRFTVLFAGQIGEAQGIDTVLQAASRTPEFLWAFLGGGSTRERAMEKAASLGLKNVAFFDAVPLEEVHSWLRTADTVLVSLSDDPLYEGSIPSKLQAYLFAGRPILLSANGDAPAVLSQAKAGIACMAGSVEELVAGARILAAMSAEERESLGNSGHQYYRATMSLAVGVEQFAKLFDDVARRHECEGDVQ